MSGTYILRKGSSMDFTGAAFKGHGLDFSDSTLPSSSNWIRGTGLTPTRASGFVSFSGTLSGVSAYMDYADLHTAGSDVIYGSGRFAFADSGFSGNVLLSLQAISTISAGATLTTASGSPLSGAYAAQFKMLFDGATINSGAISAVACFLYQSNTTPINGEQTSILQLSVDSGLLQNIIHLHASSVLSTYFLNVDTATSPFTTWGADNQPNAATADLGIRCKVGSSEYWIPLYVNT